MLRDSISHKGFYDLVLGDDGIKVSDHFNERLSLYHRYRCIRQPMKARIGMLREMHQFEGFRAYHQWMFFVTQMMVFYGNSNFECPEKIKRSSILRLADLCNRLETYFLAGSSILTVMSTSLRHGSQSWIRYLLSYGFLGAFVNGAVSPLVYPYIPPYRRYTT